MGKIKLPETKQAERLAKVTGAPPPKKLPAIPGFIMPPEGMNLKQGQMVEQTVESSKYTAEEREGLTKYGWTPQSDVAPDEVREVIELLEAEALVPTDKMDPARPRTAFEVKEYEAATAEQKKHFNDAVAAMRVKRQKEEAQSARLSNHDPSVRAAIQQANKVEVEDDLDAKAQKALVQMPSADDLKKSVTTEAAPTKEPADAPKSESGAAQAPPLICENCGHDTRMAEIEELPISDRLHFLNSLMGGIAYQKAYKIFSGRMTVKFRSLTSNELDACFLAGSFHLRSVEGQGMVDLLEITRRYRLCLQFQELQGDAGSELNVEAPTGLCAELSPGAQEFWANKDDGAMPLLIGEKAAWLHKLFQKVYDYLQTNVFKQDHTMRVIFKQLNQFNRECYWLESRADDPNFLPPAEKQP